jgi:hypothetical protein
MVACHPLAWFTAELDEEPAQKCLNCGEYLDATIIRNRAAQTAGAATAAVLMEAA